MSAADDKMEIDDSLYSRQRYVLGDSAMLSLAQSNVLIYGLGGLGIEIAKNIVLAGVKSVTLQDSQLCTYQDLGTQFFLRLQDVKESKNRALACAGRVAELNPYVAVNILTHELNEDADLSYLSQFQCIVLTETSLQTQLTVNAFCRSHTPPVKFISTDVRGVFCWSFCDFGSSFEVYDTNGEEPREVFIGDITKENPGIVTTLDNKMHGFQSGDTVTFKEVKGMIGLNGRQCQIEVISPYKFSICDVTGDEFASYSGGGVVLQVKTPISLTFESLQNQLTQPSLVITDLANMEAPGNLHLGFLALHRFSATYGRLPNLWCSKDADQLFNLATAVNLELESLVDKLDKNRLQYLSFTSRGCFAPLCAFLGGVVAQEALKALTGKFTPVNQWLYVDAVDILAGVDNSDVNSFQPRRTQYDALRMCIGEQMCKKLAELHLFMVGCGAIGCEMLKNYSLLGVCTSDAGGKLVITDNDLIEKSNLNRQFLFRPHHIRLPKSTTAAHSAKEINPDLNVEAQQHKVCQDTESTVYTDAFFSGLHVVINALDNLEARRYMDSRCVTNQRPLLESGTMGAKGHVQVIVPHLTESYSTQRDPVDEDVPYCTLKSFPAVMDHCIEWARDKFETIFSQKPSLYNKFWATHHTPKTAASLLDKGVAVDGGVTIAKMTHTLPSKWSDCVVQGRIKFEKYFNHKAQQLLHAFPVDTQLKDGSLFWQSPKRPPTPLNFDIDNPTHMSFVIAYARLFANVCGLSYTTEDLNENNVSQIIQRITVPQFQPKNKKIEVDETAQKPQSVDITSDELKLAAHQMQRVTGGWFSNNAYKRMIPVVFEKDDDDNGHIDFIAAASNLRASMYNIENSDRLKIKRIAGRIVPAIATTTAAIAGLMAIELVKVVKSAPIEHYKNAFVNLALPLFVFSEPASAVKTRMSNAVEYTIWDRWEVHGNKEFTVKQFIQTLQERQKLKATLIVQGVKMIYVPMMPGHARRLNEPMLKYIKVPDDKPYVDLVVSYEKASVSEASEDAEEMGPPVRYYYNS